MTTVVDLIDAARYDLDDTTVTGEKQHSDTELLQYFNNWYGTLHRLLVQDRCELARTGTGTITTVAGTNEYSLATASMSDFWIPYRVWIAGSPAMDLVNESEIMDFYDSSGDIPTEEPDRFYLEGDTIGFLAEPDDEYTVNLKYWPSFTAITDDSTTTPFRGLFDEQLRNGIILLAKGRARKNPALEASIVQLQQEIAMAVMRQRRTTDYRLIPEAY